MLKYIYIDYIENDKYLCFSKYEYILNKIYDKYDYVLLTNDSILIINNYENCIFFGITM